MGKAVKALLYGSANLIIWSILPSVILQFYPEVTTTLSLIGVNLQDLVLTLAILGVILAILTFTQKYTDIGSGLNLVASICSGIVGLLLFTLLIGLGDISGWGIAQFRFEQTTVILNFRFLVLIFAVITTLEIIKNVVEYYGAKRPAIKVKSRSS